VEWNAKLDWAEEIYTMFVLLPVRVIAVAVLWSIAPGLQRRRERAMHAGASVPCTPARACHARARA
jgi:hypothetical protein